MGEVLEQKDIDALLSEITDLEDQERKAPAEEEQNRVPVSRIKRPPSRIIPRSYNPYVSPVVKSSRIVMNPEHTVTHVPGHIVVRTLENYQKHRRNQNTQSLDTVSALQLKS
jgi:hypothetical protein